MSTIAQDALAAALAKHAARHARDEALRTHDDLTVDGNAAIYQARMDLDAAERASHGPIEAWNRLPQAERDEHLAAWAADETIPARALRALKPLR